MHRTIRNHGVSAAARELKCDVGHLSRVVDGSRQSPTLLRRFHEWLENKRATDPCFAAREIVEAGFRIAEQLLPEFRAVDGDEEKARAIRARLAAELPTGFLEAYQRLQLAQYRLRDTARFMEVVMPFIVGLLPKSEPSPNGTVRISIGSSTPQFPSKA